jgi:putative PIN family toxin of toxin-antitoxin system
LTLRSEGKIDHNQLKALISGVATFVTRVKIVRPVKKLSACRDTKDDMILECSLAGGVDFLITGDKDLLDILDLPFKLKILTPSEFVKKD